MQKMESILRGILRHFFLIQRPFFGFSHFVLWLAFAQKVKGFCALFFCRINKTRNSHEIRIVYSECFVFHGMFRENICEIPSKCEIRKVHSWSKSFGAKLHL